MRMQTTIHAPAEAVWPFVADPVLMSAWNEKIIEVDRAAAGLVTLGESYQITYVMSGKQTRSMCEVIKCDPPHELVIRCKLLDQPGRHVDECYQLTERHGTTQLTQFIDLRASGIPRWARAIIWLITRFGESKGTPYLEVLKNTVEELQLERRAA